MSVYIIGQLKFTDEERYRNYQKRAPEVLVGKGAKILAADESPKVLEGEWPFDKFVILEFRDAAHAKEVMGSPEYQEIFQDRKAGADAVGLLVSGI